MVAISQFGIGVLSLSQFTRAGFALCQFGIAWSLVAQFGLFAEKGRGRMVWGSGSSSGYGPGAYSRALSLPYDFLCSST